MALAGFDKTAEMRALNDAFVNGRLTMTEQIEFVLLGSLVAGARCALEDLPSGDGRREQMERELAFKLQAYREMAHGFGEAVMRAHGFL